MDTARFDAMSRSLGGSLSRRGVLAALVTAYGLAQSDDTASAKHRSKPHDRDPGRPGSNHGPGNHADHANLVRDCKDFCKSVFPPGRDRGRCISDAAHGEGLCHECGADEEQICRDADGSARCCAAVGSICHQGACCTPKTCNDSCTCGVIDPGCGLPPIDCSQTCSSGSYCEIRSGQGLVCVDCSFGGVSGQAGNSCPNGDEANPGSGGPSTCPGVGNPGEPGGNTGEPCEPGRDCGGCGGGGNSGGSGGNAPGGGGGSAGDAPGGG